MIRRSTWIVIVVLAALLGFSFYLRDRQSKEAAQSTPTEGTAALFSTSDGSPNDVKIVEASGQLVEFGRDQTGQWAVKAPIAMAADQAASEAAATQVMGLRVLANIQLGLDVVGLDEPTDTLTVQFTSGKTHTLLIGSVTPIQNGYYCQLDGGAVLVVDKLGMDALLGLLASPPYVATLTPIPSATASPAPPADTPTATVPAPSSATPGATSQTTPSPATETATTSASTGTPTP